MTKTLKGLLIVNAVILIWILFGTTGNAQLPPLTNEQGIPYFNVNINPTNVPPMVNINPNQFVPKVEITRMPDTGRVEVTRMPEVVVRAAGCSRGQGFQTAIGRSISGPLVVTYLNLSQPTQVSLSGPIGPAQRMTLGSATSLSTAIYLRNGQRLDFDADVMYSGCQPE
jgi:hypothetical protein